MRDNRNFNFVTDKSLSSIAVGLVNQAVCPLLKEVLLYKDICIGYTTFRGEPINPTSVVEEKILNIKYKSFINEIVKLSVETGYGFSDFGQHNVLQYNGMLSLIDIGDSVVKLYKNMFDNDSWTRQFNIKYKDSEEYFSHLKEQYLK